MDTDQDQPAADSTADVDVLSDLIRAVLRMNAHAQRIGNQLIRDLALTNSRWQVLGELLECGHPVTVSQLARRMGLARQSVQELANELSSRGLIVFTPNEGDQRAMLMSISATGRDIYAAARAETLWFTEAVACGFETRDLRQATTLLNALTRRMQDASAGTPWLHLRDAHAVGATGDQRRHARRPRG